MKMTTSEKGSENPDPKDADDSNLRMFADVCDKVRTGELDLSSEKQVVDLVAALKYAPVAVNFPTKTKMKSALIPREKQDEKINNDTNTNSNSYIIFPPKKRPHFLDICKDVQNEELKTDVKIKKISNSTKGKGKKISGGKISGKRCIVAGPDPAPAMPDTLKEKVAREFDVSTVMLVIQKSLFETDLKKVENRLSMTMKQIATDDFLTEEEKRTLAKRKADGRVESIEVDLIEPDKELSKTKIMLRKWDLKSSSNYVLTHNWYKVADRNKLKTGEIVQIWFFRSREGKPCFAIVNLGRVGASSSSSSASTSAVQEEASSSSAAAASAVQEPASCSSASAAVVQKGTSSSSAAAAVAVGVVEDDLDQRSNSDQAL
ncbi:hypothetical protein TIFTF001_012934 [Ficus carica]|uniref:B3 domain-containing protein n=1 Tax=Ficus carica TaxID=3494 RepID=A0AA87ZU26_FICCA|nr:hypothetical protein TIFTF001_012934 [Ficus carica]